MVFRGQPSKACHPCRQRRIKCDLRPEGCSSCKRAKIVCSGYREVEKLRFVHETLPVSKKHGGLQIVASQASNSQYGTNSSLPDLDFAGEIPGLFDSSMVVSRALSPSLDDVAVSLFYGQYDCLPGIMTSPVTSYSDTALPACIKALGLVTYANATKKAEASADAKQYYSVALKKTNLALASSAHARDDTTLLAVMLLTNFEAILRREEWSFEAWSAHIRGSAALLAVRGLRQFKTSDGRLLFMQASMTLVSHCLRSSHRIPQEIHELTKEAAKYAVSGSPEHTVWTVHQARLYLADLYSNTVRGLVQNPSAAVRQALAFDVDLIAAYDQGPPLSSKPDRNLGLSEWSTLQAYTSTIICRAILHLLVIKLSIPASVPLKDVVSYSNDQIQASTRILSELQSALLATLPHNPGQLDNTHISFPQAAKFHHLLFPRPGPSSAASLVADHLLISSLCGSGLLDSVASRSSTSTASGASDISWALLLVGHISNPSLYSASSAPQLLQFMGHSLGLNNALVIAENLGSAASSFSGRS